MKILDKLWKRNLCFFTFWLFLVFIILTVVFVVFNAPGTGSKGMSLFVGFSAVSFVVSTACALLFYNLSDILISGGSLIRGKLFTFVAHSFLASILAIFSAYKIVKILSI